MAMGPSTAPNYYRFDLTAPHLVRNLLSYLERSLVFSALVPAAVALAMLGAGTRRFRPERPTAAHVAVVGLLLFCAALLPTIALPNRSNLYAYFPSIMLAATLSGLLARSRLWPWRRHHRTRVLAAALAVACVVVPVAWSRGSDRVAQRGYVYRWTQQVLDGLGASSPSAICLLHLAHVGVPPEQMQRDLGFLELALELARGAPLVVVHGDENRPCDGPRFVLVPGPDPPATSSLQPVP
jgi:hypothetical protein